MANEIEVINIPSKTVSETSGLLLSIYKNALNNGIPFRNIPAVMLWGPPGVGKSQGVFDMAERLGDETGKAVKVTDVRLLLFNPIDLRGIPVASSDKTLATWLKPKIFDMDESKNTVNVLFLDELSSAPQSLQAAAYQICLDRKVGEHRLPDNCIVIAAGNRTTDQSVSFKMPKALCNRLMHLNVKSDYSAWRSWAVRNGISEKVIAFLGANTNRLCASPESSDIAYPTPRAWEFVSTLIRTLGDDSDQLYGAIGACVGMDTALEFKVFVEGLMDLPKVDDILAGRCNEYPKTHDGMYALVTEIASRVKAKEDKITVDTLDRLWSYAKRLPKDFAAVLVSDLTEIDSINKKLMKSSVFQMWLSQRKYSI